MVGRDAAGPFASDSYLSPGHAEFTFQGSGVVVKDLESLNGIYLRIARDIPTVIPNGCVFRIGQEILQVQHLTPSTGADGTELMGSPNGGATARIQLVIGRDTFGNAHPIPASGIHPGREPRDSIFH